MEIPTKTVLWVHGATLLGPLRNYGAGMQEDNP